jgi:Rad3-related DNA helicase
MAALLIADEHHGKPDAGDHHHASDHHGNVALRAELEAQAKATEDRAVAALEQAAARIESIAAELSAA